MAIRIVPIEQLGTQAAQAIAPLLLPTPHRYAQRAARLEKLAEGHAMSDYLRLASKVAAAQHALTLEHPVAFAGGAEWLGHCAEHGFPPLSIDGWRREPVWQALLDGLIARLRAQALPPAVDACLARLAEADSATRDKLAAALLAGELQTVGADAAPFLWAALGVYWSGLAASLPAQAVAEPGETRDLCPVCAAPPVAAVTKLGIEQGLRYLHCSLCESEWHVVRAKCTVCDSSRDMGYWALERHEAAIKTESCGDCHSYLKLVDALRDPDVEPLADDLASVALDILTEEKGFTRSGLNPFLFGA